MPTTFVYDTETTGLYQYKKVLSHPAQPHLVQLGGILFDDETRRVLAEINLLGIPELNGVRVKIPAEASDIHGITNKLVDSAGLSHRVVLPMFNNLIKCADRLVCHNADFDRKIILTAYSRCAFDQDTIRSKPHVCTMKIATPILKLPKKNGKSGTKWPSLMEAYKHFVDENGFEGAHDAMEDVRATAKVFWALVDEGHTMHEMEA